MSFTTVQIEDKVKAVVAEILGIPVSNVTTTDDFVTDLNCDSLDVVEIVMALEEDFSTDLPDAEDGGFETVQDVIDFLVGKLGA